MRRGQAKLPVYRGERDTEPEYTQLRAMLHRLADAKVALLELERDISMEALRLRGHTLSDREAAVLKLRCDGNSYKEVGGALNITERTVKFHVERIRRKFPDRTLREIMLRRNERA